MWCRSNYCVFLSHHTTDWIETKKKFLKSTVHSNLTFVRWSQNNMNFKLHPIKMMLSGLVFTDTHRGYIKQYCGILGQNWSSVLNSCYQKQIRWRYVCNRVSWMNVCQCPHNTTVLVCLDQKPPSSRTLKGFFNFALFKKLF